MSNPLCPVTGEPAVRHVQWISAGFLSKLWQIEFGVNARSSFGGVKRVGLWESATGLHFFDPMVEGDHEFYTQFYARLLKRGLWSKETVREEFRIVARDVKPGDRVLDVGCGFAPFRRVIPQADYVGLDPNFADGDAVEGVRNETLEQHLAGHAGTYDMACAFQVVEHTRAPAALFAGMVRAVKPGGLVIVSVPHVPSPFTRIPNYLINAPPHHVSWWTGEALAALAARAGASVVAIERVPWGAYDALAYWMERCSPIRCDGVYYRPAWSWHAAAVVAYLGGRLMRAMRGVPRATGEGGSLLLVARREG